MAAGRGAAASTQRPGFRRKPGRPGGGRQISARRRSRRGQCQAALGPDRPLPVGQSAPGGYLQRRPALSGQGAYDRLFRRPGDRGDRRQQEPPLLYVPCLQRAAHAAPGDERSEEHTSELQSLMRISYAVFCLKKKKNKNIKLTNRDRKHDKKKKMK